MSRKIPCGLPRPDSTLLIDSDTFRVAQAFVPKDPGQAVRSPGRGFARRDVSSQPKVCISADTLCDEDAIRAWLAQHDIRFVVAPINAGAPQSVSTVANESTRQSHHPRQPHDAMALTRLYTVPQAAEALNVPQAAVRRWIFQQRLAVVKIGAVRIEETELTHLIEVGRQPRGRLWAENVRPVNAGRQRDGRHGLGRVVQLAIQRWQLVNRNPMFAVDCRGPPYHARGPTRVERQRLLAAAKPFPPADAESACAQPPEGLDSSARSRELPDA